MPTTTTTQQPQRRPYMGGLDIAQYRRLRYERAQAQLRDRYERGLPLPRLRY